MAERRKPFRYQKHKNINTMLATKLSLRSDAPMPLIAALPYALALTGDADTGQGFAYNPHSQLSEFSASRDFSTCREDESVGGFLSKSRSDTKKDD